MARTKQTAYVSTPKKMATKIKPEEEEIELDQIADDVTAAQCSVKPQTVTAREGLTASPSQRSSPLSSVNSVEFEKESAKLRAEARKRVGASSIEPDQGTTLKETTALEHSHHFDTDTTQPGNELISRAMDSYGSAKSTAIDNGLDDEALHSSATNEQKQQEPSLLQEVLSANSIWQKELLNGSDTVIVLDLNNLTKTYLLSSALLAAKSAFFKTLLNQAAASSDQYGEAKFLLILEPVASNNVPKLRVVSTEITRPTTGHCTDELSSEAAIKKEFQGSDEKLGGNVTKIDWVAAYERFISIISGQRLQIKRVDAASALPYLETLLKVAETLDAVQATKDVIESLLLGYITKKTLWQSIAAEPVRWLLLGATLNNCLLYDEAFVHLAGSYPSFPGSIDAESLDPAIRTLVDSASKELRSCCLRIDHDLLTTTISLPNKHTGPPGNEKFNVVTFQSSPMIWTLVNLWRDWIGEHVTWISKRDDDNLVQATETCDHSSSNCLSISSLYRLLSKGGDSYLPADTLLKILKSKAFFTDTVHEATVRANLAELKEKASKIVAPLLVSGLQLAEKDQLEYLTCVKVGEAFVPWQKKHEGAEEEETEDGDEMEG